jgi:hypothetical protein
MALLGLAAELAYGTSAGRAVLDALVGWARRDVATLTPPTVTSGAINPDVLVTHVSTTGTQAFTLANGSYIGQEVLLMQTVAATSPIPTVTPAARVGYSSFNLGTAVGNNARLIWNGTGWILAALAGAGVVRTQ